jgi:hypothetical protein
MNFMLSMRAVEWEYDKERIISQKVKKQGGTNRSTRLFVFRPVGFLHEYKRRFVGYRLCPEDTVSQLRIEKDVTLALLPSEHFVSQGGTEMCLDRAHQLFSDAAVPVVGMDDQPADETGIVLNAAPHRADDPSRRHRFEEDLTPEIRAQFLNGLCQGRYREIVRESGFAQEGFFLEGEYLIRVADIGCLDRNCGAVHVYLAFIGTGARASEGRASGGMSGIDPAGKAVP